MKFGDRIRINLERKGWQNKYLAKVIGVAPTTISPITKYNANTRLDTACKICRALGIDPRDMMEDVLETLDQQKDLPLETPGADGEESGEQAV